MIKLKQADHPEQVEPRLKDLYESSFPADERRDWTDWLKLIGKPEFSLYQINDHEGFIGFITAWRLYDLIFLEHFAILPEKRGLNYGTETLQAMLQLYQGNFVLEVEEPFTETAQKRIAFYQQSGFILNANEYYQPPYSPGKNWVKLLLMSYPQKLEPSRFEEVKRQIHTLVYNLPDSGISIQVKFGQ